MNIERRKPLIANVGVMSVGLDTYWKQFPGLLERLNEKTEKLKSYLLQHSVSVVDFGMIDNASKAYAALPQMKASDLDLLLVDMVTYATSSTFGTIVREMQCPVVLVALQPTSAMDYAHGTTFMQLCNDDICSVPEFTGVAIRMGKPVADIIIGQLDGDDRAE